MTRAHLQKPRGLILAPILAITVLAGAFTVAQGAARAQYPADWPTDFCLSGFVSRITLLDDGTPYVQNWRGDFGGFEYGGPAEPV